MRIWLTKCKNKSKYISNVYINVKEQLLQKIHNKGKVDKKRNGNQRSGKTLNY